MLAFNGEVGPYDRPPNLAPKLVQQGFRSADPPAYTPPMGTQYHTVSLTEAVNHLAYHDSIELITRGAGAFTQ